MEVLTIRKYCLRFGQQLFFNPLFHFYVFLVFSEQFNFSRQKKGFLPKGNPCTILSSCFGSYLFYYLIVAHLHCGKVNEFVIIHIIFQYLIFIHSFHKHFKKGKEICCYTKWISFWSQYQRDGKMIKFYTYIHTLA